MGARNGDSWIAKISDFGLSVRKQNVVRTRAVEQSIQGFKAMDAVSASGRIPTFMPGKKVPVGTPLHVAPELANKMPFNEKADIYSFGMLIWEVITRRRLNSLRTDKANLQDMVTPPIGAGVPEMLRELMQQCWKVNQWERPSISSVLMVLGKCPEDDFPID